MPLSDVQFIVFERIGRAEGRAPTWIDPNKMEVHVDDFNELKHLSGAEVT